jgi:hypothetical protein
MKSDKPLSLVDVGRSSSVLNTLPVCHHVARQAGQKGSHSPRSSGMGLWQRTDESGGVGGRGVSQIVARLARELHRGT